MDAEPRRRRDRVAQDLGGQGRRARRRPDGRRTPPAGHAARAALPSPMAISRSARAASSSSTASGGMSVSHSISVGRRPKRCTTSVNSAHTPSLTRRTVIVDQDGLAVGVVHGMTGEMVLGDGLTRQVQPVARIEAQIVRRHGDVVHVEQQAAAAQPDELAQELGFAQRRLRETQVAGRVLDRYLPAQRLLQALHVAHDDGERLFGVGQRQEVVEVAAAVAAPGKMVRHQRRLEPLHQGGDARQMRLVEPVHRAQRQADGMNGERVIGPQGFDGLRAIEIILGVDFQEAGCRPLARDLRQVR